MLCEVCFTVMFKTQLFSLTLKGLNLEINIEQEEYMGALTPEAGIRVDISPQGEMPFPLDKGVSLAPGYATMIGLRKARFLSCCFLVVSFCWSFRLPWAAPYS